MRAPRKVLHLSRADGRASRRWEGGRAGLLAFVYGSARSDRHSGGRVAAGVGGWLLAAAAATAQRTSASQQCWRRQAVCVCAPDEGVVLARHIWTACAQAVHCNARMCSLNACVCCAHPRSLVCGLFQRGTLCPSKNVVQRVCEQFILCMKLLCQA